MREEEHVPCKEWNNRRDLEWCKPSARVAFNRKATCKKANSECMGECAHVRTYGSSNERNLQAPGFVLVRSIAESIIIVGPFFRQHRWAFGQAEA